MEPYDREQSPCPAMPAINMQGPYKLFIYTENINEIIKDGGLYHHDDELITIRYLSYFQHCNTHFLIVGT